MMSHQLTIDLSIHICLEVRIVRTCSHTGAGVLAVAVLDDVDFKFEAAGDGSLLHVTTTTRLSYAFVGTHPQVLNTEFGELVAAVHGIVLRQSRQAKAFVVDVLGFKAHHLTAVQIKFQHGI